MHYEDKNEAFFKALASQYVEQDGERLKKELEEIENDQKASYPPRLDKRIRGKILMTDARRTITIAAPVAACFLLIFAFLGRIPFLENGVPSLMDSGPPADIAYEASSTGAPAPAPAAENAPSRGDNRTQSQMQMALMSAKMPAGYNVTGIDYDMEKTIYYIKNDTDNQIVMTAEKSEFDIEFAYYQEIRINGEPVYGMVKSDFSVITYEKDGVVYTLTSRYNYEDLVDISKNII